MANEYLDQYLGDYLDLAVPPRYAVMLSGTWGAGKTHYLHKLSEQLKKDGRKVVFVSLYGLQNTREIDEQIFTVLHPTLSNPKLKLATKVIGGMLKAAVKIDIEAAGEASLSAQIPTISLPDYLSVGDQHVFIFDDFERCDIPIKTLLGYLNFYVELSGLKVIVAANQEQILEKETYDFWKEKIIGATLAIDADFASAILSFSTEISPNSLSLEISKNASFIEQLFNESGYKNLRSLRSAMLELQRIYSALPNNAKNSQEFINDLLGYYFPVAFEVRAGAIGAADIKKLRSDWLESFMKDGDQKPESKTEKARRKYKNLEKNSFLNQSNDFWSLFFETGYVDKEKLLTLTLSHPALFEAVTPRWKRLWYWWHSNQSEFEINLRLVRDELLSKTHKDIYVVMHIFGTYISLAEKKLLGKKTPQNVLLEAKNYIRGLASEVRLLNPERPFQKLDFSFGFDGLGYPTDSMTFRDLVAFVRTIEEQQRDATKVQIAKNLESMLVEDRQRFSEMLADLNGDCSRFPVFSLLKATAFVKQTRKYQIPADWNDISWGLRQRFTYSNLDAYDKFLDELPFFQDLDVLLSEEIKRQAGRLIIVGIQGFKDKAVGLAIEKLEARRAQVVAVTSAT